MKKLIKRAKLETDLMVTQMSIEHMLKPSGITFDEYLEDIVKYVGIENEANLLRQVDRMLKIINKLDKIK